MAQEKLWQCNNFGWYKIKYLCIFQKVIGEGTWESFMDFFWEMPQNVQELIIDKLHGNTKTWCIQHKTLIIDAFELIKYRQ